MADPRAPLTAASLDLLQQGAELLSRLDAAVYTGEPAPGSGTVGQHFRHVLDFYARFLTGLDDDGVRYDARERDPRIERDPEAARQRALELAARLGRLPREGEERSLGVAHDAGERAPQCASSVGRELLFLASHTTHHYALIAVLLRLQEIEPGTDFGVAVSTLEHRRHRRRPAAVRG